MIPVVPHRIERVPDENQGKLMLQLPDQKGYFSLYLPMDQAKLLALELQGLATDFCAHHDLVTRLAAAMNASITAVLIKDLDKEFSTVSLRLEKDGGQLDVPVKIVAAMAIALHIGLPIYVDRDRISPDRNKSQTGHDPHISPLPTRIPQPFEEFIEGLDDLD